MMRRREMANPAREPLRLVPSPQQTTPPREGRGPDVVPEVVVWGAYPAMRAGLRALLAEMGIDASEAVDGPEGPIVVVADAGDEQVAAVVEELASRFSERASLIVLASEAERFGRLQPGPGMPAGMLLRDVSAEELAAAVQAVASGLVVLDPEIA